MPRTFLRPSSSGIACLLAAWMLAAPEASGRVVDRVAAVVNSDVILLSEVDARCQANLDEIPSSLPLDQVVERKRTIRKEMLENLIDELLIRQQVRQHKITVTEEDLEKEIASLKKANNLTDAQFEQALKVEGRTIQDLKKDFRLQMERRKLVEQQMRSNPEMRSQIQIGEKEIEEYYRNHYSKSPKVRASHILFAAPSGTSAEESKNVQARAQKVLDQIRGGAPFDEMAKQHSDDPSGSLGGDLGWFRRGDMVASFEKAAFGLQKGAVSDLVRTQFGFHIILVTDRAQEDPPPLDTVRPRIQQQLYGSKFQRAIQGWLTELRRNSFVDIKL